MDFETVSLSELDLDWILKWNCRIGLGFEKRKSIHLISDKHLVTEAWKKEEIKYFGIRHFNK